MGNNVTLGGDRLGAGNKMKVGMHGYNRSTHNISSIWRSTMAPGTLVPFLVEPMLPGDTLDIDLSTMVRTLPTNGPVFGSFKMQMDVFFCPIRLYSRQMHNNKLGIGLHMDKILLPIQEFWAKKPQINTSDPNTQQISSSSLLKYLGISGFGYPSNTTPDSFVIDKQAIPLLAYYDIYKNYYANKQEEIGYIIGTEEQQIESDIQAVTCSYRGGVNTIPITQINNTGTTQYLESMPDTLNTILLEGAGLTTDTIINTKIWKTDGTEEQLTTFMQRENVYAYANVFGNIIYLRSANEFSIPWVTGKPMLETESTTTSNEKIKLIEFPLSNIDDMRENILAAPNEIPYRIGYSTPLPYGHLSAWNGTATGQGAGPLDSPNCMATMSGLAIKTYMSDRFNNWLNTEWIDGENGINTITAIDTSSGSFTQDALLLAQKVYNMLNRIAISGGSMRDYIESVYDIKSATIAESPMYMGGMSSEIVFNEVVSTADATAGETGEPQPLGTLGGRGNVNNVKGGRIRVKANEWGFCIGIVSITPRIDYSQGNRWFTRLETMDQWHKPAMDAIGFQEMTTDEMAAWDTRVNLGKMTTKSAGKQPAWTEYMTNVNECFGEFADEKKLMFMTLNRQYQANGDFTIKDLTTYIDPTKYNYIFATRTLETQGFWIQIAKNMKIRRVMSAKIMPTL